MYAQDTALVFAIYPVMLYSLQNRGHKACSSHVYFIFAYLVLHESFNSGSMCVCVYTPRPWDFCLWRFIRKIKCDFNYIVHKLGTMVTYMLFCCLLNSTQKYNSKVHVLSVEREVRKGWLRLINDLFKNVITHEQAGQTQHFLAAELCKFKLRFDWLIMWRSKSCHYPKSTDLVQGTDLTHPHITCEPMCRFSPDSSWVVNRLHKIRGSRSSEFTQPLLILSLMRTNCVLLSSLWFWWSIKFSIKCFIPSLYKFNTLVPWLHVSVFYKTIFRPSLTIGRYVQCVHTLWDPIVFA